MAMQKKQSSKEAMQQALRYTIAGTNFNTFNRRAELLLGVIVKRCIELGYVTRFEHIGDGVFELESPPINGKPVIAGGKIFSLLLWAEGFMVGLLGMKQEEVGNKLYHTLQCDCEACEVNIQEIVDIIANGNIPTYYKAMAEKAKFEALMNKHQRNNPN